GEGTGAPALAPQPAVGDIDQLVEQVRGSGVDVSVVRMGTARRLPPGIDLTVYRICQESLTNILKHAGPSPSATVMLQWKPEALVLQVSDDGRGAAAETDGVGQGVLGMRERAAMLGGTLTVGPRPGGGYRVRAEIPIPPHEEHR
uniref:sensor histidine kinase n=1 Tax=Actinotalea sp. C106 TaxID=2908644 RepID=UPI0027E19597